MIQQPSLFPLPGVRAPAGGAATSISMSTDVARSTRHLLGGARWFVIKQQGIHKDEGYPRPWGLGATANLMIYY